MYDSEYDELYDDDRPDPTEEEEWFEDDCRERARDMQEYCRCQNL